VTNKELLGENDGEKKSRGGLGLFEKAVSEKESPGKKGGGLDHVVMGDVENKEGAETKGESSESIRDTLRSELARKIVGADKCEDEGYKIG